MKLWIDDIRPAPDGYRWCKSVREAQKLIYSNFGEEFSFYTIEEINIDHDAGEYYSDGGDYINLLKWLEKLERMQGFTDMPPIHIHSQNIVGVQNMRAIINANNWEEI